MQGWTGGMARALRCWMVSFLGPLRFPLDFRDADRFPGISPQRQVQLARQLQSQNSCLCPFPKLLMQSALQQLRLLVSEECSARTRSLFIQDVQPKAD